MNLDMMKFLGGGDGLKVAKTMMQNSLLFGESTQGPKDFIESDVRIIKKLDNICIQALEEKDGAFGKHLAKVEIEDPESKPYYTFTIVRVVKQWETSVEIITDLEEYYFRFPTILGTECDLTTADLKYIKEKINGLLPQ